MTDQIVDNAQVFLPGPEGPQGKPGERGLPGVNAVPADQAVADYLQAPDSALRQALESWRPAAGTVTDLGVDNTGGTDAAARINALAATAQGGLYFPAGVYRLEQPIQAKGISIVAHPGARFVAARAMTSMLSMTGPGFGPDPVHQYISGGLWDGAGLAERCITAAIDNTLVVEGVSAKGATQVLLDVTKCHGATVRTVYLDGLDRDVTGIDASSDSQFTAVKIMRCLVGVKTRAFNSFADLYVWGGTKQAGRHTVGIQYMDNGAVTLTDSYLDTLGSGVQCPFDGGVLAGSGLFWYANGQDGKDADLTLLDTTWQFTFNVGGVIMDGSKKYAFSSKAIGRPFDLPFWSIRNFSLVSDPEHVLDISNRSACQPVPVTNGGAISIPSNGAVPILRTKAKWGALIFTVRTALGDFQGTYYASYNGGLSTGVIQQIQAPTTLQITIDKTPSADGYCTVYVRTKSGGPWTGLILVEMHPSWPESTEDSYVLRDAKPVTPLPPTVLLT